MSFSELPGQIVCALGDPLLWAAMILVALRVPQRFMLPTAIAVAFTMQAAIGLIEGGALEPFRVDPPTWAGRALAAWFAGAVVRFFIERGRNAPSTSRASAM